MHNSTEDKISNALKDFNSLLLSQISMASIYYQIKITSGLKYLRVFCLYSYLIFGFKEHNFETKQESKILEEEQEYFRGN